MVNLGGESVKSDMSALCLTPSQWDIFKHYFMFLGAMQIVPGHQVTGKINPIKHFTGHDYCKMPLSYVSFTDKENNNCTISCCFVTILMCVTAAETTDLRCSTSTDTVGIAFFSHVWERVNLYKHHMHAIGVIL